ncbi:MAG: hypothetical protein MJZ65_01215 [Paludibacteraceae bacterium]|nr:hypothetical protein [Paludibacteraceae bacterium]
MLYCLVLLSIIYCLLSITYSLPPTTYHLLPTTYYLLPTTYHLLPTTYYLHSQILYQTANTAKMADICHASLFPHCRCYSYAITVLLLYYCRAINKVWK